MTISEKIKKIRKSKGWSQTELAERLGTAQKVISTYESGIRTPPVKKLQQISKLFGLKLDELVDSKTVTINGVKKHTHRNSRQFKIQKMINQLAPKDQHTVLNVIKSFSKKS